MCSEADIIHSHVNGEDIVSIEVSKEEIIYTLLKKYSQYDLKAMIDTEKKMLEEAIMLKPKFAREVHRKECELGISFKLWSCEVMAQFEEDFKRKYMK